MGCQARGLGLAGCRFGAFAYRQWGACVCLTLSDRYVFYGEGSIEAGCTGKRWRFTKQLQNLQREPCQ
jgi:hypothetical protein